MALKSRITSVTLVDEDDVIFSEGTFIFTIEDEAAGEFIKITQLNNEKNSTISLDKEEIEEFIKTLRKMAKEIRG